MDLEVIILSEVRERQIACDITCMWNLKQDPNEPAYETETKQNQGHREQTGSCHRGIEWKWVELRVWGQQMQTGTYRMDKQQGLLYSQGTIFNIL